MKKEQQILINDECLKIFADAMEAYERLHTPFERLRSSSGAVCCTGRYYILQSYRTIVAVIDRTTDTCIDVLRYVYGYTATSAQHISKFAHDYGAGKWGCENRLTWRRI